MSSAVSQSLNQACLILPYGYQIDLDFIKYCENLTQLDPSEAELRRRQKRRQRQSMEVMLGIQMEMQNQMDQYGEFWTQQPPEPPPRTHIHSMESPLGLHYRRNFSRQQEDVTDWDPSLNEVVDDFEKTLEKSKNKVVVKVNNRGSNAKPLPGESKKQ